MITLSITWWWNLSRQLEQFMEKIPFENYADSIIWTMKEQKDENFKREGKNMQINPKWSPLTPSTQQARAKRSWYYKKSPNRPWVLRWTWNLQDNISTQKSKESVVMKFNADYAYRHQRGNWRMHRVLFEFNNPVKTEIIRAMQTYFNKEIWVRNARK